MDTNDLSRKTHMAIIDTAERFRDDLTLQFGVMANDCSTDDEFLDRSESLINNWINNWDLEDVIRDIFFEEYPAKKEFR